MARSVDLDEVADVAERGEVDVGDVDVDVKREAGARRRKLHSRPFFSQLAHLGCLPSHYRIGQLPGIARVP